jgi:hypothetical protein
MTLCPRPLVHGKASTYTNHRCRCEPCRIAWREYRRAKVAAGQCWQCSQPPRPGWKTCEPCHAKIAIRWDAFKRRRNAQKATAAA